MNIQLVFLLFAIVGNSLLGLFTFYKNPKSSTNKLFSLFTLFLNSYLILNYLSLNQISDEATLFWIRAVMSNAVILGLLFYFLAKTFPKKELIVSRQQLILSLVAATILFFLTQTDLIFQGYEHETNNPIPGKAIGLFAVYTLIFLSGGFIELALKLKNSTTIERIQTRLFIYGTILMFTLILTTNFFFVVVFKMTFLVGLLPLYTLVFVGFVSYAIIRHRFLDIRLIVARAVAYVFLLLFIGLGYIAFLFDVAILLNNERPTRQTVQDLILPAVIALLFAMSFQPLRRFFEKITDRFLYKDRYDSNSVLWDLSRIMASTLNLSELSKKILEKLLSSVKINYGAIVLMRHSSIIWVGGAGDISGRPFKGKNIYELVHASNKSQNEKENILIFEELAESNTKKTMREHNITVVLLLIVRKELIGGILLGEKSSGEIYSSEDIDLLKIFAPEVAVAVKNALSYDEIKRFNITLEEEVKRATEKLRKANTKLKELDILKDEFVSIASHELRTPMTAIKSYLWMAINQPEQEIKAQLKKYLEISYASTERLIRLVNDMLTVSRIERNKIDLKLQVINVCEIVQMVYDELKISADEKHIDFKLLGCADKRYNINADKEKMREVFQNIVGNALKFTPEKGKITIDIKMSGTDKVAIEITDTGPGIQKEDLSKLFQKFSRLEYSYAKHSSTPGTGLGLYISKKIVGLHNGDITVESEVGAGAAFSVILSVVSNKPASNENEEKGKKSKEVK